MDSCGVLNRLQVYFLFIWYFSLFMSIQIQLWCKRKKTKSFNMHFINIYYYCKHFPFFIKHNTICKNMTTFNFILFYFSSFLIRCYWCCWCISSIYHLINSIITHRLQRIPQKFWWQLATDVTVEDPSMSREKEF